MKLDRNTNPDGAGKYALLKIRRLEQIRLDGLKPHVHETQEYGLAKAVDEALGVLNRAGVIHWGNESPGDQFFVMKYKDKFTAPALRSYAMAAREEAHRIWLSVIDTSAMILGGEPLAPEDKERRSNAVAAYRGLIQYANELDEESFSASKLGCRIPD